MSFHSPAKRGKLVPALAISFLLHILLLWPSVLPYRSGGVGSPLVASLRSPPPAPAAKRPLPAIDRPTPPPLPPAVEAATAKPSNAHISTTETALRSPPAATETTGFAAAAPSAPPAATAAGDGVDADGVRQYRLALAVEARRYKRYPARALEANLGGTVEIRVAVAAGGLPQEVLLARSSGHELLDDAALEMMKKAAPRAAVPERLRGRAFAVNLPVVFDLADD